MTISIITIFSFAVVVAPPSPTATNLTPILDMRCGVYCLTTGLSALGENSFTLDQIEAALGEPEAMGYSLQQLSDAAKRLGFETVAVRSSLENLNYRRHSLGERFTCIAAYGPEHFLLVSGSDGKIVRIVDPPRSYTLDVPVFAREWTGNCVLIGTEPLSNEETVSASLRTRGILMRIGVTLVAILSAIVICTLIARLRNLVCTRLVAASIVLFVISGCADRSNDSVAPFSDAALDATNFVQGGQIEITPARHSLGVVRGGQERMVPVRSRIRNNSDEVLQIGRVTISCACTEALVGKHVLQPGEATELKAIVKIGDSQEARSTQIKLESSDRHRPVSEIDINWVADLPLKTEPKSFEDFGLSINKNTEFDIAVISKFVSLCDMCEVNTGVVPESLNLEWIPNLDLQKHGHSGQDDNSDESRLGTLKVKVLPKDVDLHHRKQIEVELSCRGKTIATTQLPMTWTFRRSFGLVPSRVFFGTLKSGQTAAHTIVVRSLNNEKFSIRSVRTKNSKIPLDTKIEKVSDESSRISLTITAPSEQGPWTDEIVIETDSQEQPIITAPVSCLVE